MNTIGSDRMDSRELQERLDELEAQDELDEDETDEMAAIRELRDECDDSEWKYGIEFIREDDFEDYARQLAEDIGAIDRELGWPACHIDWEAASDSLKMDYMLTEVGGIEYRFR